MAENEVRWPHLSIHISNAGQRTRPLSILVFVSKVEAEMTPNKGIVRWMLVTMECITSRWQILVRVQMRIAIEHVDVCSLRLIGSMVYPCVVPERHPQLRDGEYSSQSEDLHGISQD